LLEVVFVEDTQQHVFHRAKIASRKRTVFQHLGRQNDLSIPKAKTSAECLKPLAAI
jgi:hypothetical protein